VRDIVDGVISSPYQCPVTAAMQQIIGGKWRIIILWAIGNDVNRFGMLQRAIPGITKKMLTTELRALEEAGLISRTVFPVVPPRVEYAVTPLGETLRPALEALDLWGETHVLPNREASESAVVG
jgi:DNA-binding HxlR family transcriptional regulator